MSTQRYGRLTDAPAALVLTGVRAMDPGTGSDAVRDVAILDGRLVPLDAVPADAERVDCRGLVAAPGFLDLHTHLREPGGDGSESIESGARAAAHGGYTTICAMPNTEPALDDPDRVAWVLGRAAGAACRVRVIGAVTSGRAGAALADLDALATAGAVAVSDDGAAVSEDHAEHALTRLAVLGLPLVEHAEAPALAGRAVMREGHTATRIGLEGWPTEAEASVVRRDIALAAQTDARLHLTHLSTAAAVDAVRDAKARRVGVTADVTPHHIALTDEWVGGAREFAWEASGSPALVPERAYDGSCRVNPPLATREDALALLEGLRDGTIDAIATDHAPHSPERKLVPFNDAAPGLIGLETALSIGLAAVEAGMLPLMTLLRALTTGPAGVIGETRSLEVGGVADLVLFDPAARWRVERSALASLSANTPLMGMELPGVVRLTVADGRVTYRS